MYRVNRELCRYLCVLNVILTMFLVLAGPQAAALLTGLSAVVLFAGMHFFDSCIAASDERRVAMHNDGSNDVETWKADENETETTD